MSRYKLVALSSPLEGRGADFAAWYDRHIGDCMRVPGIVAAERFELSGHVGAGGWHCMILYEMETDNPAGVVAEMFARLGTEEMPASDAVDTTSVVMAIGTPVAVA